MKRTLQLVTGLWAVLDWWAGGAGVRGLVAPELNGTSSHLTRSVNEDCTAPEVVLSTCGENESQYFQHFSWMG